MMHEFMNSEFFLVHREKIIKGGVIGLIVLAAIIVFLFHTGSKDEIPLSEEQITTETQTQEALPERAEESPLIVVVDVQGAVVSPSVVRLDEGARVEDAIAAAGGLAEDADVSNINRAEILHDGEKIYIPAEEEDTSALPAATSDSFAVGTDPEQGQGLININTATAEELETLKGVGPATANKIIEYRTTYGAFESVEDIKNVSGIGDKTFEGLKDQITV